MNIDSLKEKMIAAEAFLNIANYLASRPPYLVEDGATEEEWQAAIDRQILSRGITCHLLYTIVFEIVVKVIWELDNQKECPFIHNLVKLYSELSPDSQQEIVALYDFAAKALAESGGTRDDGTRVQIGRLVRLQSLDEALEANEDTMKNFKYDLQFKGKSSIFGAVIWIEGLRWVPPRIEGVDFLGKLFNYALNRLPDSI